MLLVHCSSARYKDRSCAQRASSSLKYFYTQVFSWDLLYYSANFIMIIFFVRMLHVHIFGHIILSLMEVERAVWFHSMQYPTSHISI